jgi:hypothetical protein
VSVKLCTIEGAFLQGAGRGRTRRTCDHERTEHRRREAGCHRVTSVAFGISRERPTRPVARGQRQPDDAPVADHQCGQALSIARSRSAMAAWDALRLLGERLAAGVAERRVRALEAGEAVGVLRADLGRTSARSSRRCRSRQSARPPRLETDPRGDDVGGPRGRGAAGCNHSDASTTPAAATASAAACSRRCRRAVPTSGPGSGLRGCRPSARGGPGGWSCGGRDYCALSAPTKTATVARSASRGRWRPLLHVGRLDAEELGHDRAPHRAPWLEEDLGGAARLNSSCRWSRRWARCSRGR